MICYIDDILVTGKTEAEHLSNLEVVLKCLLEHGVCLKKENASSSKNTLEYCRCGGYTEWKMSELEKSHVCINGNQLPGLGIE